MCDDLGYDEDDLYYDYGEGFEDDLIQYSRCKEYDEPLDTTTLNKTKVKKNQLDDYFLVLE